MKQLLTILILFCSIQGFGQTRTLENIPPLLNDGNLLSYWKFENNTTDSKGGNNGTATDVSYISGLNSILGQCASFNNNTSKITLPNVTTGTYSFSCWFNLNAISSVDHYIYVQDNIDAPEIRLMVSGDNYLRLQVYSSGAYQAQLAIPFSDVTKWHHVCAVWGANDARLYLDGVLVSSDASVSIQTATTVNHSIGWYSRASARYFNGYIDDAALFNRALTTDEVYSIYVSSGIQGYWRLDGNSNDASGNGNNGTDTDITYSQANGRLNQGAGFNGSSSKITTNCPATITKTYSILFKTSTLKYQELISQVYYVSASNYKLYELYLNPSGLVIFLEATNAGTSDVAYTSYIQGAWNLVTVSIGNNHIRFMLNGKLIHDRAFTQIVGFTVDSQGTGIGALVRLSGTTQQFFNGSIDEAKIINYDWSIAEMKNEHLKILGAFSN